MLEKISICIATYKRFEMLSNCILKINELDMPANVKLNILIVDGALDTHKEQVEHIKQISKFPLLYNISKKNGIASNRNQLMDFAIEKNADYIAFIDDDEYPNKNWIFNLYNNLKKHNADVAAGGVNYIKPDNLPDSIPQYLIEHFCSKAMNKKTSIIANKTTIFHKLATNNILLSIDLCKKQKLYFDEKFNFTGGEDTDFFTRSNLLNNSHLWVNNAEVYEIVTNERISLKYLFQRRKAVAMGRIALHKKYHNIYSTYFIYPLKIIDKSLKCLLLLPSSFFIKKQRIILAIYSSTAYGYLLALLRINNNHYKD